MSNDLYRMTFKRLFYGLVNTPLLVGVVAVEISQHRHVQSVQTGPKFNSIS